MEACMQNWIILEEGKVWGLNLPLWITSSQSILWCHVVATELLKAGRSHTITHPICWSWHRLRSHVRLLAGNSVFLHVSLSMLWTSSQQADLRLLTWPSVSKNTKAEATNPQKTSIGSCLVLLPLYSPDLSDHRVGSLSKKGIFMRAWLYGNGRLFLVEHSQQLLHLP